MEIKINWLVVAVLGIWFFAAIAAGITKDSQCIGAALAATIVACILYYIIHD